MVAAAGRKAKGAQNMDCVQVDPAPTAPVLILPHHRIWLQTTSVPLVGGMGLRKVTEGRARRRASFRGRTQADSSSLSETYFQRKNSETALLFI